MPGTEEEMQPYPAPRYAWWVAGILAVAYMVGYIDRQALSLMTDMVKADLGVSDSYMGWLNGSFDIFNCCTNTGSPFVRFDVGGPDSPVHHTLGKPNPLIV